MKKKVELDPDLIFDGLIKNKKTWRRSLLNQRERKISKRN